jgi:hypothetical protein
MLHQQLFDIVLDDLLSTNLQLIKYRLRQIALFQPDPPGACLLCMPA